MWHRLTLYPSAIVLLFFSPNLVLIAYAQNICEGAPLGSPLERILTNEDITDPFNPPNHYGTDYQAADGDNVLAVNGGTIRKISYDLKPLAKPNPRTGLMIQGFGRYVVVEHTDGSTTLYAHLQMDSTNHLSVGQEIIKGTIIGKVDSTGGVTGPHLHLQYSTSGEIFNKSSLRDPHPCIVCGSENISELTVYGPDTPSDGDQYTATGGVEPYTWSITKGSITQDGIVTISGQCSGPATITVTDSCGLTKEKGITISAPEITIAGPDAPSDGSQYIASGGIEPYAWSITKGSITTDGVVTVSGQCGTATITVTDSCGYTAAKDVRMQAGVWTWVSSCRECPLDPYGNQTCGASCGAYPGQAIEYFDVYIRVTNFSCAERPPLRICEGATHPGCPRDHPLCDLFPENSATCN